VLREVLTLMDNFNTTPCPRNELGNHRTKPMSALTATALHATITFLGINRDGKDLSTSAVQDVEVSYGGFVGDSHSGLTRHSCVRVAKQYPKGTEIRNVRQISALSADEPNQISQAMETGQLSPAWVGANLILNGIPSFTQLPPSSRLIAANGTALVVDMENRPCKFPGNIIDQHIPGKGVAFPKAAVGKRGVTLWVEREGTLSLGDTLTLHIPPVCTWQTP